jgi:hypothetical protein
MTILGMLVVLIIVGVVLWLVNTMIPMDAKIKMILNVVVVIFVLLWLAEAFGIFSGLGGLGLNRRVGR